MNSHSSNRKPHVLIAGGGIAGLEAMMAIRDHAGERVDITLVAPDPDFVYKPLIVEEPFSAQPAEQHALAPIAEQFDAQFIQQPITAVLPKGHKVELADGSSLDYERLILCIGARPRPAFAHAVPLRTDGTVIPIDSLLRETESSESGVIAFVIPPGRTWPLPVYELALMAQRRVRELGLHNVECCVVTPEESPLIVFGRAASDAVSSLLAARGIKIRTAVRVKEAASGQLLLVPGDERIDIGQMVSLPVLEGPGLAGIPADEEGFIPIDDHARVRGVEDIYAAGDGTNFPIKHGGIGTEEADAAAEHIGASLGAEIDPQPFRPVIRGKLLTGDESLHMQHDVAGGGGEGTASPDYLWWPPGKVAGRYLSAFLGQRTAGDLEPPPHLLDVEVALPEEWHKDPMALDPLRPMP
ncbi:MAG: FAD-dependent oxidoreductase [Candidatus Dormibacteraeota bacterium]|nr:FAD-dependent oxidoreductase [Candidatus Dormibacteraeota bacterium]